MWPNPQFPDEEIVNRKLHFLCSDIDLFSSRLSEMFYPCIDKSVFPNRPKQAAITPIYEKDNLFDNGN